MSAKLPLLAAIRQNGMQPKIKINRMLFEKNKRVGEYIQQALFSLPRYA